jgi:hypothetical protein
MSNLANGFAVRQDWRDDGHDGDEGPALAGEPLGATNNLSTGSRHTRPHGDRCSLQRPDPPTPVVHRGDNGATVATSNSGRSPAESRAPRARQSALSVNADLVPEHHRASGAFLTRGAGLVIRDLVVKNDEIAHEASRWTTGERREPVDIGDADGTAPEVESIHLPTTAGTTPDEQDDSSAAAIEPPEGP